MKSYSASLGALSALVLLGASALAETKGDVKASGEQTPVSGWRTSCAAPDRAAAVDCTLEQGAFIAQTGQLVAKVTVRVDGADRKPALMIQTPLGLHLPTGVEIRVDDHKPESLALQTCDAAGCYAGMALSDALLARMSGGRQLLVSFQDLSKREVKVTMPLEGFSEGLKKIR
jgi:invasion protein IalB